MEYYSTMKILMPRLKSDRHDFETHLKYATLIADLSAKLKITSNLQPKLSRVDAEKLKDKIKLVKLTKVSIDQEYEIVSIDGDYSTAAVLWLPTKTYYLIYHLLCIVECLLTGKKEMLSAGHHECINEFTRKLKNMEIVFNEPLFNSVFDAGILDFKTKSGEILKSNISENVLYPLLMKKLVKGKIENYKIVQNLSASKTKDKVRINSFKSKISVSVFDFFHLMRLRTTYRDLDFVDNIPSRDTKLYFEKYRTSADNFYKCFARYINELLKECS